MSCSDSCTDRLWSRGFRCFIKEIDSGTCQVTIDNQSEDPAELVISVTRTSKDAALTDASRLFTNHIWEHVTKNTLQALADLSNRRKVFTGEDLYYDLGWRCFVCQDLPPGAGLVVSVAIPDDSVLGGYSRVTHGNYTSIRKADKVISRGVEMFTCESYRLPKGSTLASGAIVDLARLTMNCGATRPGKSTMPKALPASVVPISPAYLYDKSFRVYVHEPDASACYEAALYRVMKDGSLRMHSCAAGISFGTCFSNLSASIDSKRIPLGPGDELLTSNDASPKLLEELHSLCR